MNKELRKLIKSKLKRGDVVAIANEAKVGMMSVQNWFTGAVTNSPTIEAAVIKIATASLKKQKNDEQQRINVAMEKISQLDGVLIMMM